MDFEFSQKYFSRCLRYIFTRRAIEILVFLSRYKLTKQEDRRKVGQKQTLPFNPSSPITTHPRIHLYHTFHTRFERSRFSNSLNSPTLPQTRSQLHTFPRFCTKSLMNRVKTRARCSVAKFHPVSRLPYFPAFFFSSTIP